MTAQDEWQVDEVVTRHDACPGCSANVLDLSEEANRRVCGVPEHTCRITFEVLR